MFLGKWLVCRSYQQISYILIWLTFILFGLGKRDVKRENIKLCLFWIEFGEVRLQNKSERLVWELHHRLTDMPPTKTLCVRTIKALKGEQYPVCLSVCLPVCLPVCPSYRNLCVSRSLQGRLSTAVTVCWTSPPSPLRVWQTSATVAMARTNKRIPCACATLCPSSLDSVSMLVESPRTGGAECSVVSTSNN